MNFYEQYSEFDAFITSPEPSNPWTSDNVEFWEQELTTSVLVTVYLHHDPEKNILLPVYDILHKNVEKYLRKYEW